MRGMTFRLLHEMMQEKTQNIFLSPVWILKSGIVFEQEQYYVKVFFFANEDRIDIKELHFELKYNDKVFHVYSNEFVRADSYKNDKVFGCIIPFPDVYSGESYTILLNGIKIGEKYIDYTNHERGEVYFDVFVPDEKKKFLKQNIRFYLQFPRTGETYWQCICGQHNPKNAKNCYECFSEQDYINKLLDDGLDRVFLNYYFRLNPMEYNPYLSFDHTYEEYVKKIVDTYSIDINLVKDIVKYELVKESYPKLIEDYSNLLKEKKKDLINEIKNKLKFFIVIFFVFFSVNFSISYGPKLLMYMSGLFNLWSKNYEEAIINFTHAEPMFDSNEMIDIVYLDWSKSLSDKDVIKSIKLLEQISDSNLLETDKNYKEYANQLGVKLFEANQFEESIKYLEISNSNEELLNEAIYQYLKSSKDIGQDIKKINQLEYLASIEYKDSKSWINEVIYDVTRELIELGEKENAITNLKFLGSYKDSSDLLVKIVYELINEKIEQENYEATLKYIDLIKDTSHGKELYNTIHYQLGLNEELNDQVANALKHYRLIKEYKDVSQRINNLESGLSPWSTEINFGIRKYLVKDLSEIQKNKSIYIRILFKSSEKMQYIIPKVLFIFPDGQTKAFIPNYVVDNNEYLYYEFLNGFFEDPEYRPTGILTVEVYDLNNSNVLVGTSSIEIVD